MVPNAIFDSLKECFFERYDLQRFQNSFEPFSGFKLYSAKSLDDQRPFKVFIMEAKIMQKIFEK